eukprot:Lithocolla_globosa_v1_NODE_7726_length_908_cov_35.819461.p2 type:complete len:106 gc:universal NODE_7726_length_908_cov_35.819461:614-297(-)
MSCEFGSFLSFSGLCVSVSSPLNGSFSSWFNFTVSELLCFFISRYSSMGIITTSWGRGDWGRSISSEQISTLPSKETSSTNGCCPSFSFSSLLFGPAPCLKAEPE